MSVTDNKYQFLPAMQPGMYAVFRRATKVGEQPIRVPGLVSVSAEAPRIYTYQREQPVKGRKPTLMSFTAKSVAELSQKIDDYFNNEETSP